VGVIVTLAVVIIFAALCLSAPTLRGSGARRRIDFTGLFASDVEAIIRESGVGDEYLPVEWRRGR
jgi:hypothetical protein